MRRQRNLLGPQGMGGMVSLWGASSLIKSIQTATATFGVSSSSATATIAQVDTSSTLLLPNGFNSGGSDWVTNEVWPTITLTNSTTVTANKYTASASRLQNVSCSVVEFMPGIIKSIQYVQWTYVGTTSGDTQAITAVNQNKSAIVQYGTRIAVAAAQTNRAYSRIYFSTSSQLTVNAGSDPYGSGYDTVQSVAVVEFF